MIFSYFLQNVALCVTLPNEHYASFSAVAPITHTTAAADGDVDEDVYGDGVGDGVRGQSI